jgi:acyl-CoA synthetase (AMP-forming)/AMP-acid ligase II
MNIALLLDAVAAMAPTRTAVQDGDFRITYGELLERAHSRAQRLAARASSRPLFVIAASRPELVELLFASAIAGVPFVPLNYRQKAAEIAACIEFGHPGLIVVEPRYRGLVDRSVQAEVVELDVAPMPAGSPKRVEETSAPAVCLFTSGTTAAPKLAVMTHENLSAYIVNTVEPASASAEEAVLISTPSYHVAWIANVLSNVFRGRRLVLRPQFDAREWLQTVNDERVTHAMVVPTMLTRLLDVLAQEPALAPLTLVNLAYGGARASEGLIERAIRILPRSVGLVNAFGLTETSSTVAMLSPEDHRAAMASTDTDVRARLQSVGKAVPGVELRIVRDDGAIAQTGESGQLWIRGEQVSPGYVGRAGAVDADGWLHSGDRAFVDAEGYLFVTGRLDDVIIRGGENIDPAEIEEVLEGHPSVSEAVVVGLPDAEWGQVLAALIVGDRAISEEALRDWVRARLASHKVPKHFRWATSLPRNDVGKIVRREARALLEVV